MTILNEHPVVTGVTFLKNDKVGTILLFLINSCGPYKGINYLADLCSALFYVMSPSNMCIEKN